MTPNWKHNSGKCKQTKGMCKGKIKARTQSLQSLKLKLQVHQLMTYSNLSKIKPKLRTQGRVSGNFGRNKVISGSPISDLGVSSKEQIKCATPNEYLNRMYYAFDNTQDPKLRKFIYAEIRKIHIQRGTW